MLQKVLTHCKDVNAHKTLFLPVNKICGNLSLIIEGIKS